MKLSLYFLLVALPMGCLGQQKHYKWPDDPNPTTKHYLSCVYVGGSSNIPHGQDTTEKYRCGNEVIELHGRWSQTVEYGDLYQTQMGRLNGEPKTAMITDRDFFKWCRLDERQVEMCGWNDGWKDSPGNRERNKPWKPKPNDFPPIPKELLLNRFPDGSVLKGAK